MEDLDDWNPVATTWTTQASKKKTRQAYGGRRPTLERRESKKRAIVEEESPSKPEFFRASFSSSSCSSSPELSKLKENTNPNLMVLPPTKVKKVQSASSTSSSSSSFSSLAKLDVVAPFWTGASIAASPAQSDSSAFDVCASPSLVRGDDQSESDDCSSMVEESDSEQSSSTSVSTASDRVPDMLLPPIPIRRGSFQAFNQSVFGRSENLLDTMSSYADLKFLIVQLRKEKRWMEESFGIKSWTVTIPKSWDQSRRTTFLKWITKEFGFAYNGASIPYCQIKAARGLTVLQMLEEALREYKREQLQETKPAPTNESPLFPTIPTEPSIEKIDFRPRQNGLVDSKVDVELRQAIDALSIKDSAPKTSKKSLVRTVTLDPKLDVQPVLQDQATELSSFNEEAADELNGLPTFDNDDDIVSSFDSTHRLSGEGVDKDFVNHLHGWSPLGQETKPNRRAHKPPSISPIPQSSLAEFVETPLLKRGIEPSGGSFPGRDWNASSPCEPQVLKELLCRFENFYQLSGVMESPLHTGCEASIAMSAIVASEPNREVSTGDLGFDFEVDHAVVRTTGQEQKRGHERRGSVGATAFAGLNLHDTAPTKSNRKRILSFKKIKRMSNCFSTLDPTRRQRFSMFGRPKGGYASFDDHVVDLSVKLEFPRRLVKKESATKNPQAQALYDAKILHNILMYMSEGELLRKASLVCTTWADAATEAHASLMLMSVGCSHSDDEEDDDSSAFEHHESSIARSMSRSWQYLVGVFPWGCFLGDGAYKRVYRTYNTALKAEEAVSVMDVEKIDSLGNKACVGAELAVSVMLSSLVRRNICPNFVITRGTFTCAYEPPASHWGHVENRYPKGKFFDPAIRRPREPRGNQQGRFQYIRMELCREGDLEEYIKRQPNKTLDLLDVQSFVFQLAFALHAAGDRFSMKHYDVKLLNVFLQHANIGVEIPPCNSHTVLQYGVGRHVFNLRTSSEKAFIVKLADYGTANVQPESDGDPIDIAHFTTIENTPPEFFILGDKATQGCGHDNWGLGLCILHCFTGHAPYEEIMQDVTCPPNLRKALVKIWQNAEIDGYRVIRTIILDDVDFDEHGCMEGEPDQTFYDTFYRYLVLLGIPGKRYKTSKEHDKVWDAISCCLEKPEKGLRYRKKEKRKKGSDAGRFAKDQRKYSLERGNNKRIKDARERLMAMDGAMDLLLALLCFDPNKRATPLDVLNSNFMLALRADASRASIRDSDIVHSYMAYSANRPQLI